MQRTWETDKSTTSTFSIDRGKVSGYFLEPPADSRIPAGTYNVGPHSGPKWQGVMGLENVLGYKGILIHPGNYPNHF
ncbi:MAG: hypothetical protein A2293_05390 [Elusimicrobia bacterium RIFOXYB2_FULL_49_7]|nr:MAG: hypothetical protein A2293_05390 [Elusimicrobia bacterium RIFOXYB2_FULL_49_7]